MRKSVIQELLSVESTELLSEIQIFDEIDSTNVEAIRQIRSGNSSNCLILAKAQSAGRGRRGRNWASPPEAGIYMSMVRQFTLPPNALQALSLVTALSVKSALEKMKVQGLKLKWPNDILFEKKKLAGILLELQQQEERCHVVFGIGLNIALPQEVGKSIGRPVTDIVSITGLKPDLNMTVAAIVNELCINLTKFEQSGFSSFTDSWNESDCYFHSDVVIQNGERSTIGKSLGVDSNGALLLQTATGKQLINGGEVFPSLRELPT
ncbi:MAG: biotin--[acetyl-CoA-carboxylase] ligase [SAR86 cluster bacterium]|uniref:biotin--[biotin carboxyl-carrier protein] ligase n=1 Tax=SAR86 cluster bacterium TaxID=2030880 RepID=A0A2A5B548_9GAMM|nr:MAG: biotin--[acetyl-CoA-carboxylase] ligase [SAR86 cluster bacterium]